MTEIDETTAAGLAALGAEAARREEERKVEADAAALTEMTEGERKAADLFRMRPSDYRLWQRRR